LTKAAYSDAEAKWIKAPSAIVAKFCCNALRSRKITAEDRFAGRLSVAIF